MNINDPIINAFFHCPLKAYYLKSGSTPEKMEFHYEIERIEKGIKKQLIQRWQEMDLKKTYSIPESLDENSKHLKKHVNQVDQFYDDIKHFIFKTEKAKKLKARLLKNRDKLFLFLHYDNIPWNNNNAEFAIKAIAEYRKRRMVFITRKAYLII